MNALANEQVAAYVNEHFIATYLKVGTFQIVNGQKVGGNVASYFCLWDGAVVHAVPGPVDAKTFLSEARWAIETRKAALTTSTNLATGAVNLPRYLACISQAHEERYFAEQKDQGQARNAPAFSHAPGPRAMAQNLALLPAQLPQAASRQAQADWLLAIRPLAPLDRIYPVVWEHVLGEKLSSLPVAQR